MKTIVIASLLLGTSALAQVNTSPTNNTLSGNVSSEPAALKVSTVLSASKWLATRLHTIDIGGNVQDMANKGVTARNFVAGFSAEGAIVYNYEIHHDELKTWDQSGRNAGIEVLPYTIELMADGTNRISVSTLALRNMNALQNSDRARRSKTGKVRNIWKFIDNVDVISVTWDKDFTFNNMQTLDLDLIKVGLKFGLAQNSKGNYLALRAGGSYSARWQKFTDNNSVPKSLVDDNAMSWGADITQYYGGIEGNLQNERGLKVNVQVNYVGGNSFVVFDDRQILANNAAAAEDEQQVLAAYNHWEDGKEQYEKAQGHAVSNADYVAASGIGAPPAPGSTPEKWRGADAVMKRMFGYVKSSLDVSLPINHDGRPMRIGLGAEVNTPIIDSFDGYNGLSIDMSGHYTQRIKGKLYLNF